MTAQRAVIHGLDSTLAPPGLGCINCSTDASALLTLAMPHPPASMCASGIQQHPAVLNRVFMQGPTGAVGEASTLVPTAVMRALGRASMAALLASSSWNCPRERPVLYTSTPPASAAVFSQYSQNWAVAASAAGLSPTMVPSKSLTCIADLVDPLRWHMQVTVRRIDKGDDFRLGNEVGSGWTQLSGVMLHACFA